MWRLIWSQLRFRPPGRWRLLAGLLLAIDRVHRADRRVSTAQLRTVGTVSSHFLSAYEILVRPKGARTALE